MTGGIAIRERVPSTVLREMVARVAFAPERAPLPAIDPVVHRRVVAPTPAEAWADALPDIEVRIAVTRPAGAYTRRCPAATHAARTMGRVLLYKRPDAVLPDGTRVYEASVGYLAAAAGCSPSAARSGYDAFLAGSQITSTDYAGIVALGVTPRASGRLAGGYLLAPPDAYAALGPVVRRWERMGLLPAPRPAPLDAGTWITLAAYRDAPGRNAPFRCPSGTHADLHPSASGRMDLQGDLGTWHCFACGARGLLRRAQDGTISARVGFTPQNHARITTVEPSVFTNDLHITGGGARGARSGDTVHPNAPRRGLFSAPYVNPRTSPKPTRPTGRSPLRSFDLPEQSASIPAITPTAIPRQTVQPTRRSKPVAIPAVRERPWRPTARPPVRPMLSSLGAFGHRYRGFAKRDIAIVALMADARTKWPSQIAKVPDIQARLADALALEASRTAEDAEAKAADPSFRSKRRAFDRRAVLPDSLFGTGVSEIREVKRITSRTGQAFTSIRRVETVAKGEITFDLDALASGTFEESVIMAPIVAAVLMAEPRLAGGRIFGTYTSDTGNQFTVQPAVAVPLAETETVEWKAWHADVSRRCLEAVNAAGRAGGIYDPTAATAGQFARLPAWRITKQMEVMPSRLILLDNLDRANLTARETSALASWEAEIAGVFKMMFDNQTQE